MCVNIRKGILRECLTIIKAFSTKKNWICYSRHLGILTFSHFSCKITLIGYCIQYKKKNTFYSWSCIGPFWPWGSLLRLRLFPQWWDTWISLPDQTVNNFDILWRHAGSKLSTLFQTRLIWPHKDPSPAIASTGSPNCISNLVFL